MTLNSTYRALPDITLPEYQGRQMYMHTFTAQDPKMPEGFEDYLETVTALCQAVGIGGQAHMTVDEKVVQPGMSQRRPGAHVDGYWLSELCQWGIPSWSHYCNNVPVDRMHIIVASSVPGCIVYPGTFNGEPKNDGDLEHIRDQFGEPKLLPAGKGFLLSPDCVHESMIFDQPTQRTFLRIAFSDLLPF